jgi:hypothetical protein
MFGLNINIHSQNLHLNTILIFNKPIHVGHVQNAILGNNSNLGRRGSFYGVFTHKFFFLNEKCFS